LGDFNGIGTPGVIIAGTNKKSVNTDFQFYEVGKSQFSLEISSAEISPRVCTAKLRCFGFKEMDHCYVVCVVLRCKFSQLRLKC
jgi:hypothetical protein